MDSRQEKIRLLARINRGRSAAPAFVAALSEAMGESVDETALLPPADSDAIMEAFRVGYQNAIRSGEASYSYGRFCRPGERNLVLRLADCLAEKLSDEHIFFITKLSKDCVAVSLRASALLKHTASIIRFDGTLSRLYLKTASRVS